ncbi:MAG: hypothetical protein CL760_11720 [Chloroflexi bacterium]|nr:hypothetical protein [Chloroflexota bacterium]|tara:strand:+ start:82174 stop:82566 length:393 start_codon:yes stop_codon:yes gene_type:complete
MSVNFSEQFNFNQEDIDRIGLQEKYEEIYLPLLFKIEKEYDEIIHRYESSQKEYYKQTLSNQNFMELSLNQMKRTLFVRINLIKTINKEIKDALNEISNIEKQDLIDNLKSTLTEIQLKEDFMLSLNYKA